MSNNYPPGTWEGDPRAPWNAPDAPECNDCGWEKEWDEEAEDFVCQNLQCDSFFTIDEQPTKEDIEYLRAENSAEWQERHGGGLS
jgi:hypothetical protein